MRYESIHLHAFGTDNEIRQGLNRWINFYNTRLPRSSLDVRTPDKAHWQTSRPGYTGPCTFSGDPTMKAIHLKSAVNLS
jgi:hypothetical protein